MKTGTAEWYRNIAYDGTNLVEFMDQAESGEDWYHLCQEVKGFHGGGYPDNWWSDMKLSGKMDEIMSRWGSDSRIRVAHYKFN